MFWKDRMPNGFYKTNQKTLDIQTEKMSFIQKMDDIVWKFIWEDELNYKNLRKKKTKNFFQYVYSMVYLDVHGMGSINL